MATYWENSCSFGLRYVSWYKYLIVSLVFSHLGFWSGNLFLIAPFPDLCLLVPFFQRRRSLKSVYGRQTGQGQDDLDLNKSHTFHLPLFRSQAATVSKISIIFTFSHVSAYISKIDLAVTQVKVMLGSSFYQTMMGCSPKCYIQSFVKIGLPVLEKKIFECFLPWVLQPSWSCDLDFAINLSSPLPINAPHKISL